MRWFNIGNDSSSHITRACNISLSISYFNSQNPKVLISPSPLPPPPKMQLLALALLLCAIAPVQAESASSSSCRIIPGDAQWPSQDTWNAFNESVSGRLIRTVPLASPCHNPSYNADECSTIQANWHDTSLQ